MSSRPSPLTSATSPETTGPVIDAGPFSQPPPVSQESSSSDQPHHRDLSRSGSTAVGLPSRLIGPFHSAAGAPDGSSPLTRCAENSARSVVPSPSKSPAWGEAPYAMPVPPVRPDAEPQRITDPSLPPAITRSP